MKIGIMCATVREMNPLLAKLENKSQHDYIGRTFHEGKFGNKDVVAVIGGVGKVNGAITAQALIEHYKIDKLIFTGIAGGLAEGLKVSDVIIGTKYLCHDIPMDLINNENVFPDMPMDGFTPDEEMLNICKGLNCDLHFGTIITGDQFISGDKRDELIARFNNPMCVDMETASVAQVCWFYKTPLLVIRALSDTAGDNALEVYEENAAKTGISALNVVAELLTKL